MNTISNNSSYSSSTFNTTWTPNVVTTTSIPNDTWFLTLNTTNSASMANIDYKLKRCRKCKHAHTISANQSSCVDDIAFTITFVSCDCKEYIPSDNLDYIEWLYNKRQKDLL